MKAEEAYRLVSLAEGALGGAETVLNHAVALQALGRFANAAHRLQALEARAKAGAPGESVPLLSAAQRVQLQLKLGLVLFQSERLDAAEARLRLAVEAGAAAADAAGEMSAASRTEVRAQYAEALVYLGVVLSAAGGDAQLREAKTLVDRAVTEDGASGNHQVRGNYEIVTKMFKERFGHVKGNG